MAAFIEQRGYSLAKLSVKQHLAALRVLFDWLVVGQVIAANPVPEFALRSAVSCFTAH